MSLARTLLVEDALKKILTGSSPTAREKMQGLIPLGKESCFGDFPKDFGRTKKSQTIKTQLATIRKRSKSWHSTTRRPASSTRFRVFYDRGDLPVCIDHGSAKGKLCWKLDLDKLDYQQYLAVFFDGLREKEDPYRFIAVQGTYDLMARGGDRLLPVVPQLIIPIKEALNTRDTDTICTVLKVLQTLVQADERIGAVLVPYYRSLLPILNIFRAKNNNLGDGIEYEQRKNKCLGDVIRDTLELLERTGGEEAFDQIKYMIPTYESVVLQ